MNKIVAKSIFRSNPNHEPAGSPEGGQFAPGDGGGGGGDGGSGGGSNNGSHSIKGMPSNAVIKDESFQEAMARGAHDLTAKERVGTFIRPGEVFDVSIRAKQTSGATEYVARNDGREPSLYNPRLATLQTIDTGTPIERTRAVATVETEIKPLEESGALYRGMSAEEYDNIQKTGVIQSIGSYNLGDAQIGATFFSPSHRTAESYASSFAPWQYQATFAKPAYVIAIKQPTGAETVGPNDNEVGIKGNIDKSQIIAVWKGEVYDHTPGTIDLRRVGNTNEYREGSRSSPSSRIAWSRIDVKKSKGINMSVIHKTHASDTSGMDFVLSDATPDRYGDVILADGWDLVNFRKNPIALFGHKSDFPIGRWENLRVKDGALIGHLKMAPLGTSERIDEIRKLIEAGILKAVSVGFRPLESKPISKSAPGEIYVKSELVETSVVSVPANPNALAVVKSLGISRETQEMIFAKHGTEVTITQRSGSNGKHAKSNFSDNRMKDMTPLAKRIEDVQTKVVGLRDQLEQHLQGIDDDAPDDSDTAVTDTLTQQLEASEKSLDSLKRAEAQLAKAASSTALSTTTVSRERDTEQLTVQRHRPFAMPAGPKPTPSDYLFKALAADIKHFGEGRKRPILDVVKEHYGDQNDMGEIVRTVMSRMVTKAAAIPADTTTSGWADTLVQTVIGDFIQSLMPNSIYPALRAKGGSFTFGRNGTISLPARTTTTTVAGAFVAQGAPIPVRQGAFTPITLTPKKMGVITTLTREITEHSTPAIEAILRQAMMEDTGVAIDTILLDATAASSTRPAGLKNGISKVSANGTASIVGFIADLTGLAAALITATAGNIRAPAWIMNPGDVLKASLLQTTTGDTPFRQELAGGTLLGYPVLQTTTGLSDMMALIDAADFITATGDTPQFSVSDQAVLHMEDTTPLAIGTAGTPPTVAAPVRSLWQTDSLAIRMILDINWAKRRTGVFQWTDTMAWN